ncbi:MAG: GMC family oxidoreductase [Alphaproteobacteria bacterium]|nr:GMC family oxidoreductase [Alphaproteobacteria bacterium]
MDEDIIIGSGPAGAAAAEALLDRGRRVRMLDVGETLEPAREAVRLSLAGAKPAAWDAGALDDFKRARPAAKTDTMRPYGSDFPFRDAVDFFGPEGRPDWLFLKPSFALGGLSNGWGASVLPYREEDISDWPAAARALAAHYAAVAAFVPIAANPDPLEALFPMLSISDDRSLPLTSQGQAALARLEKRRERLAARGLHFGRARQAVEASGCERCGLCLYGCPYRLIFSAKSHVERLVRERGLDYRPGAEAVRILEGSSGVTVATRDPRSGETAEHRGARVFVGAGVLPTARLMLASLGAEGKAVRLKDSTHFFVPMLHAWAPRPDPVAEPRHTLTQLYLEILDAAVNARTVHFQVYAYNDHYAEDMRARFGRLAPLAEPLIAAMSRRLMVAQGFLHSDSSPEIEIRLAGGAEPRLAFALRRNEETGPAIARAVRKLAPLVVPSGLLPLLPLVRPAEVGSSYHCGGTFPMREAPSGLESDPLGRPAGLKRVHIVDASVFPSVPATTITLTVMANAHRIASAAPAP